MSVFFDKLREDPLAKEIDPQNSSFSNKRSEGEPCLFFDDVELDPLMGHALKHYENGVLLYIKEDAKYFSNSKSYVFYNLKGQRIFSIYNTKTKYVREIAASVPIPPTFDIEIQITQHYIHVIEKDFETQEEREYFINISSGKKLTDIFEVKESNHDTLTF